MLFSRHATPVRGARLLRSASTALVGKAPVYGPVWPAMTGVAAVKSPFASRLTRLSFASQYGVRYS